MPEVVPHNPSRKILASSPTCSARTSHHEVFSSLWQDLNNLSLNKRTLSTTNLAGSATANASSEYKSHFSHSNSDSNSHSNNYNSNSNNYNSSNNSHSSPAMVPNGEGIYSREVLMHRTVDELPEGVDPTKKEVTAFLL